MNFKEALIEMKKGSKVKLPGWWGYWYWNPNVKSVFIHTKDGRDFDIRQSTEVDFTLSNVASNSWQIVDDIKYMPFSEALEYLRIGCTLTRKAWDFKDADTKIGVSFQPIVKIVERNFIGQSNDLQFGWYIKWLSNGEIIDSNEAKFEITVEDMMANDWYLL